MKRNLIYLPLVFFLILIMGCEKDELPDIPESNSPIFKIVGEINGDEFFVEAGEAGWLMESKSEEVNGVNIFSSILQSHQNKISLSLYDGGVNLESSLYEQIVNNNQLNLAPDYEKPLFSFNKNNFDNGQFIESILWEVNGNNIEGENLEIHEPGIYNVCATINFYQGGSIKTCNEFILGFKNNAYFDLKVANIYNDSVKVKFISDYPIESVSWKKGGQVISTEDEAILQKYEPIDNWKVSVDFNNGVRVERNFIYNFNASDLGLFDFSQFSNNDLPAHDYAAVMNFDLDQGSFSLKRFSQDNSIAVNEIKKYDSSNGENIYMISGSYEGEVQNNETEDFVDAKFNFTFALSLNN